MVLFPSIGLAADAAFAAKLKAGEIATAAAAAPAESSTPLRVMRGMFWVISRPAISLLKLQATLCSSDRLILPSDVSAHNCRNNFDFIAVYEIVGALKGSAWIQMRTCNLSDRDAHLQNARALMGSKPPTLLLQTPSARDRQAKQELGLMSRLL
ncbi:hypothetical protein [Agrobacterium sp. P15N1-A]|uniref:hypothetical protein n=1 Tax=Agrobacterium sp. P15N1-A TaxID=3342820 RepID=UPI0037D8CBB5